MSNTSTIVINRGALLDDFKKLGTSFWPEHDTLNYIPVLEMFLAAGTELFPKHKLAGVLESLGSGGKKTSNDEAVRLIIVNSLDIARYAVYGNGNETIQH